MVYSLCIEELSGLSQTGLLRDDVSRKSSDELVDGTPTRGQPGSSVGFALPRSGARGKTGIEAAARRRDLADHAGPRSGHAPARLSACVAQPRRTARRPPRHRPRRQHDARTREDCRADRAAVRYVGPGALLGARLRGRLCATLGAGRSRPRARHGARRLRDCELGDGARRGVCQRRSAPRPSRDRQGRRVRDRVSAQLPRTQGRSAHRPRPDALDERTAPGAGHSARRARAARAGRGGARQRHAVEARGGAVGHRRPDAALQHAVHELGPAARDEARVAQRRHCRCCSSIRRLQGRQ